MNSRTALAAGCLSVALLCAMAVGIQHIAHESAVSINFGRGRQLDIHVWDWLTVPSPQIDTARPVHAKSQMLLLTIFYLDIPAASVWRVTQLRLPTWPLFALGVSAFVLALSCLRYTVRR